MFNYSQRRYLGNKFKLNSFIQNSIEEFGIKYKSFADIFAGTGSVGFSQLELGKEVILNDILYSNCVMYEAFAGKGKYSITKLENIIKIWNDLKINENNYFSLIFGNKYFELSDSKKLGYCREQLEILKEKNTITQKEYYILLGSLIYSMDRIAVTVGHYDAYRENAVKHETLKIKLIKPLQKTAVFFNKDTNLISREISADVVYIDPPYNSRQYGDLYHVLENYAKWEKPETFGKAVKMDRRNLKSQYSTKNAAIVFETLINSLKTKYIIVSYNDTGKFASGRSASKMTDEDILKILKRRGKVKVYRKEYSAFNSGKTNRNKVYERLFICKVESNPIYMQNIKSPLNYVGGKFSILNQIKKHLPKKINHFYDLFAGALNVGINSESNKVYATETLRELVEILNYIKETKTVDLINNIEKIISKYKLSYSSKFSYEYYGTNSSKGLSLFNKDKYLKLRDDYNNTKDTKLLLVLIIYSFNNIFRFNLDGNFNAPVGKRDFNSNIRTNMIAFSERMKDIVIEILNKSYEVWDVNKFKNDDFIFIDPPYWICNAVYNNNWSEKKEIELCNYIRKIDDKGIKFMMTNALRNNSKWNMHLKELIEERKFNVIETKNNFLNSSYNKNDKEMTLEVIIKNY